MITMLHIEIPRRIESSLLSLLGQFPVVAIVGPRQAGKSTLAHRILPRIGTALYLDLELPSDLAKLRDPEAYLTLHAGETVCIDEVQRMPDIFPLLRALVDRDRRPHRYLVLGSASSGLLRQSGESLAGRIAYSELQPFTIDEVAEHGNATEHWLRGGFPDSFLAEDDAASYRWREQFVRTFLERDIPALGIDVATATMERLWTMLAASNGSTLNRARFADPIGVSPQTVARYIDILESTFMVRVLRPFFRNTKKRLVRTPKIYLRDSGLLHTLLRVRTWDELYGHPAIGASWEAYALEQILGSLPGWNASFYRSTGGAEIDLVLDRGTRTVAVEFKATSSPRVTKGFYLAADDIQANERYIVAPLAVPDLIPFGGGAILCRPENVVERLAG
ncbi:MAG: ATP-binding protein [Spirochaeta sp.]|nr:ATP-binding protein [Spirochaeta sp.]